MIRLTLHGRLGTLLTAAHGSSAISLDAASPQAALGLLAPQVEGLAAALEAGRWVVTVDGEPVADAAVECPGAEVTVRPAAEGEGPETWIIIGVSLLVAVVATQLIPVPEIADYSEREPAGSRSSLFSGPVNQIAQGGAVPVIYGGPIRVGSTVVSGGITAERIADGGAYGGPPDPPGGGVKLPGGSGGGGSAPRAPAEQHDTLETRSILRVVDLLG